MQLKGKVCGVCGKPAATFFVHGYRCNKHQSEQNPCDAIFTENTTLVIPGLHKKKPNERFVATEIIMVSQMEEPLKEKPFVHAVVKYGSALEQSIPLGGKTMENDVLKDIVDYATQKLMAAYGFCGVAEGPRAAMLNSSDRQGNDIKIKIDITLEEE